MDQQFPYSATFDCPIQLCSIGEESFISKASLDNLKSLIPQEINFEENIDLLGLAYNAAVVNMFNKNHDGINSATAASIINKFLHKPTNIEHDKSKIVGHIVNAGFSEFGKDNQLVSIEDILSSQERFNLSLGSVFYKYANKEFTKLMMRSIDPEDTFHNKISTSWEVGFSSFQIAVGSENLKDAEIISNPLQIKELKPRLKAYGGSGKLKDGTRIFRLLGGDLYPLGIGFTSTPAAQVEGIVGDDSKTPNIDIKDKRDKKTYFDFKKIDFKKKNEAAISQIVDANVKQKKETIMDVEQILSEVKTLLVEKKFSEEAVASMSSVFADAIKQKDAEYRDSLSKAQDEKDRLEKEYGEMKASLEDLQNKYSEANEKIIEFENFKKQEEAVARFNARMEVIDQEFELDDEDRKVLVDDLKSLGDSEEAFASYKTKLSVMWRGKNKEAKASIEKSIQERIDAEVAKKIASVSQASTTSTTATPTDKEVVEKALDKAEASESQIPNAGDSVSTPPVSLREKFASAFSRENISIN